MDEASAIELNVGICYDQHAWQGLVIADTQVNVAHLLVYKSFIAEKQQFY